VKTNLQGFFNMRIGDMLIAIAQWLESPNNEAMLLSEYDDNCLKVVSESCVEAAQLLKKAAREVEALEPEEESKLTAESLEELASIATAFDSSNDPSLKKQASVIDELLLTIAAPENFLKNKRAADDQRIKDLESKYRNPSQELESINKVTDSLKDIENSDMTKRYRIMEHALSTRYDPDMPGVLTSRVGDNLWQSEMTKKVYNYGEGYSLSDGSKVPGSSVSEQTHTDSRDFHSQFDDRESRLGQYRG
jgi:hypothetical protein